MTNREDLPFYIGTSDEDINLMLNEIGLEKIEDLFSDIDESIALENLDLPTHLEHADLKNHISDIANKNNLKTSFIGDGLQDYTVAPIVDKVCAIRGLTTAYTPYQPERSQGTLQTLWLYQSAISSITGFEAVNASLYERSTCLYEAINCAIRFKRKKNTVLVANSIYPGDKEVIETLKFQTSTKIQYVDIDHTTGKITLDAIKSEIEKNNDIAAITIPQVNTFGNIEDFNEITDYAHANDILIIAIIDPVHLANSGLKEPASWGENGADIMVAEGQHLCIGPNFGGPGLGIFAVRTNPRNKGLIRSTAGRFIGKAKDINGREAKAIILSTREQHIRREKATSNICSNQSFLATICGSSLLNRGDKGLNLMYTQARETALTAAQELTKFEGVELKFKTPFVNEFVLNLNYNASELMKEASKQGIHLGVNVSNRCSVKGELIKLSFSDRHSTVDVNTLIKFFKQFFKKGTISNSVPGFKEIDKRLKKYLLPSFDTETLNEYYIRLGKQNLSPDDGIYPLGSCTMKYNPYINDWAASLKGFTDTHPQAPQEDVQGNLEILFETQEWFKKITGLPGLTTQPVAGAQGELVGLKLFQAYHKDNDSTNIRDIVIIPKSAHGTNPATATMAGFETKKVGGVQHGIVTIDANSRGQIDFNQLQDVVKEYGSRICAVMVTNPNTAGIFEKDFKKMSELIHSVGGFVYMDGANMNAIAGWIDLGKLGVDAVHNNLHKTWSIPHGGGGPGDAIVAVSEKLIDYLPGVQIFKEGNIYKAQKPLMTIGSFHRHHGNFAHKVRGYTYLRALGSDGIKKMSAVAVLSARYLFHKLQDTYPTLPAGTQDVPRMHEFILTLSDNMFEKVAKSGTPKAQIIAKIGKLFLDFGFHAPTVAFPEVYGLMIEPTESYSKAELDDFTKMVKAIYKLIDEAPEVLKTAPHFTPIDKVDEVSANKELILNEKIIELDPILEDRLSPDDIRKLDLDEIITKIKEAHLSTK